MSQRVAIIGAGPCGLGQLVAFATAKAQGAEIPEIVCFEKQSDWGGLWNYTWRTGLDEYGQPVHGSMYRYLWSNGPKECLEFADYSFEEHFGQQIPSFPPRAVLADYILGRAKKHGVRDWIKFSHAVNWVTYDSVNGNFMVSTTDLPNDKMAMERFDQVIVATGHFSTPNVPYFEGLEKFPGRVLHAHDFRDAQEFAGKNLLVVGASYSAEDIGLQCYKYGATSVTFCYRTNPMGFHWPERVDERPLLQRLEGKTAHFKDGSSKDVDAIVLCTGYQHHFPFLDPVLRLETNNRLWPNGLYKGVTWIENPQLHYLGMQDQYYTFTMFDAQAWFVRDVIVGRIQLPPKAEMEADAQAWRAREEALEDPFQDIRYQADYIRDLMGLTDYPKFDVDATVAAFDEWEHDKERAILSYRNKAFTSPVTGTKAPVHHTPWIEAMDDSLETFLSAK